MRSVTLALVLSLFMLAFMLVGASRAQSGRSGRSGRAAAARPPAPVMVLETVKGTIEITLDPANAPKSVDHILGLVKDNFYRGLRIHRVEAGLVQFGDPASRDMTRLQSWGTGSSGTPVGVAEIKPSMRHVRGAVGLAHTGDPKYADSQIYIMKAASPGLDGKHAIIGHVTKGMEVVDKLQVADLMRSVTIR